MAVFLGGSLLAPAQARPDREDRQERKEQRKQRDDRGERAEQWRSRRGVLTRDEAARRAQQKYGGRVLSVDLLQSDNAPARYRIKLLSEGNVRTVDVNALED